MVTIEIDQDIYDYLLKRVRNFDETASDVLRRELGLSGKNMRITSVPDNNHGLAEILESSKVKHARGVVGKFLEILAAAYTQNESKFALVLDLQGRKRTYFAKSKEEIELSGNSTQPKQIPGTPYWVMTNSPTSQKEEILGDVLNGLGYSQEAIRAAALAISK